MRPRAVVLGLSVLLSVPAQGDPLPPAARAEVIAILANLESSGCRFERNGSWHSAAEAKSHLMGKLDYVERKATPRTAEDFIELAATRSSASGRAYRVECPGQAAVPSATWLQSQLNQIRGTPTKRAER